ncbi:MAG: putative sulfate exporter family transporter [Planctomycetaceae bacterium]|nr:putative sulfate exporter family transporter [Planctomycetaceae bacterium]
MATQSPDDSLYLPVRSCPFVAPADGAEVNPEDNQTAHPSQTQRPTLWQDMRTAEDWWAIWCGAILLVIAFSAVWMTAPVDLAEKVAVGESVKIVSPLKSWISLPATWKTSPIDAFYSPKQDDQKGTNTIPGILGVFVVIGLLFAIATWLRGKDAGEFLKGFPYVFLLTTLSFTLASQSVVKAYNLEYALWALLVGLIISNTVGTPRFLKAAAPTEFYIKTGLVLLGASVLMSRLLALGIPGVFVAWVVTPIVLISTYLFGQRVLKMESKSLNMVISADMSVCGVSAAIATAAACRAKKEELSLAIAISLAFTAVMMVVLPMVISAVGMNQVLAGAWMGGTIDATGAVAAAGALVGDQALEVAATVKMIQNILIGVTAFGVAVYWVTFVERDPQGARPSAMEIWYRFPKFVIGFVLASVVFSLIYSTVAGGPELVDAVIKDSTKTWGKWLFGLAFVSIGLETNFRELTPQLKGGKPLLLYVVGQSLNLCLTLLMAWLMFGIVFKDLVESVVP